MNLRTDYAVEVYKNEQVMTCKCFWIMEFNIGICWKKMCQSFNHCQMFAMCDSKSLQYLRNISNCLSYNVWT